MNGPEMLADSHRLRGSSVKMHVQPNENGPGEAATSRDRDTERIELSMPSDHTAPAVPLNTATTTRYRDEPAITCTNVYCAEARLGYVFHFQDRIPDFPQATGRWYYRTSHLLNGGDHDQPREGYATKADARAALIAVWEARS